MVMFIYIAIIALLFATAFFAKRRFGLLGLALAAGSILTAVWGYEAGLVVGVFGFQTNQQTATLATSVLLLLPAGILMFHGLKTKSLIARIINASLFTVVATAFLIVPLSQVLVVHGLGSNVYNWMLNNNQMVIGIGLVIAIADLFLQKPSHSYDKHHKKH